MGPGFAASGASNEETRHSGGVVHVLCTPERLTERRGDRISATRNVDEDCGQGQPSAGVKEQLSGRMKRLSPPRHGRIVPNPTTVRRLVPFHVVYCPITCTRPSGSADVASVPLTRSTSEKKSATVIVCGRGSAFLIMGAEGSKAEGCRGEEVSTLRRTASARPNACNREYCELRRTATRWGPAPLTMVVTVAEVRSCHTIESSARGVGADSTRTSPVSPHGVVVSRGAAGPEGGAARADQTGMPGRFCVRFMGKSTAYDVELERVRQTGLPGKSHLAPKDKHYRKAE
ncbi:hypothetical protein B0H11DRAFT_2182431 [Mycena galericulata]|nr:hypothetical protein B0H11DRAFT_2182431 [Mycena galericulata]